jgi:hypothetical protein
MFLYIPLQLGFYQLLFESLCFVFPIFTFCIKAVSLVYILHLFGRR